MWPSRVAKDPNAPTISTKQTPSIFYWFWPFYFGQITVRLKIEDQEHWAYLGDGCAWEADLGGTFLFLLSGTWSVNMSFMSCWNTPWPCHRHQCWTASIDDQLEVFLTQRRFLQMTGQVIFGCYNAIEVPKDEPNQKSIQLLCRVVVVHWDLDCLFKCFKSASGVKFLRQIWLVIQPVCPRRVIIVGRYIASLLHCQTSQCGSDWSNLPLPSVYSWPFVGSPFVD